MIEFRRNVPVVVGSAWCRFLVGLEILWSSGGCGFHNRYLSTISILQVPCGHSIRRLSSQTSRSLFGCRLPIARNGDCVP